MLTCFIGRHRHLTVGIGVLAAVLLLAACTSTDKAGSSDKPNSTSTALAGLQEAGKIRPEAPGQVGRQRGRDHAIRHQPLI